MIRGSLQRFLPIGNMMKGTAYIEVERPIGWRGEVVDMDGYDEEKCKYFEVEVEGDVNFWCDPAFGADADGNRGIYVSGADVEFENFKLFGDFRPWYIKFLDFCLHRKPPSSGKYSFTYCELRGFAPDELDAVEESLIRNLEDACDDEW